tara:strand:- start:134 stop:304 length:171 start_codon:yes stop_codon:yes gene_type:complete
MTTCNNCGHESHCGKPYSVKDEDGFTGEPYQREICKVCRCEKCVKITNNEDLFNGA